MATTTNYGWTTPNDTDLVKDGASAIRTLGSSVDTTTKNLNPQTTTGALAYRSATSNVNTALPIGSTGQVLTVAGGVPTWATPAGGGKVLQVVYGVTSTTTDITSTSTYSDTTLTADITPSSATSKVLILTSQTSIMIPATGSNANMGSGSRILRGSTVIFTGGEQSDQRFDVSNASNPAIQDRYSLMYLDSPSTTSLTTYKTQGKTAFSNTISRYQNTYNSTIILMEIGA